MDIIKEQHTIKELAEGYVNNQEDGVMGFGGKLDIRPPYQREFVYKGKQKELVIDTVLKGFPLNIMYWNTKDDGAFEVLDGQQRTISICEYVAGNFSFDGKFFGNQPNDIQQKILNYSLDIYKCKGTDSERIDWFQVINVAGEVLTNQEILNAIYSGSWTAEAKKKFSKTDCPAYQIGSDFMAGSSIRQDYLETAIKWISNDNIKEYMGKHQHDANADELWNYYENVISWVNTIFINNDSDIRKKMQGVAWGELYNKYKDENLDSQEIQARVANLFEDEEVTNLAGIYLYVLNGNEKHLSIRAFKERDKIKTYEKQKGICANKKCPQKGKRLDIKEMHADHIKPWSKGGKTEPSNCQVLCAECNRIKSNI